MIGFRIDTAKGVLFDSQAVLSAADRGTRTVLNRFGAFVRTKARDLTNKPSPQMTLSEMSPEQRANHKRAVAIAKRKGKPVPKKPRRPSEAGEPPRRVTGVLRRFIKFAFDPDARSVVVGAEPVPSRSGAQAPLEHGGTTRVKSRRGVRRVRIAARPFMVPALDRELPKLPAMWRDAIR